VKLLRWGIPVVGLLALGGLLWVSRSADPAVELRPTDQATLSDGLTAATIPGFPNYRENGSAPLQLHLLPARVTAPVVKLPPKLGQITDEFVLEHEEQPNPKGAPRELVVLRAPLPFPVSIDEQTFKPEGMEVRIDGKLVPFSRTPAPKAKRSTWRITNKYFILTHPTLPAPGAVTVRYHGVLEALDRHDPAKAGLSPEEFVRYDMTIKGTTRHGLLLPAPTIAEWDVKMPTGGATFEGWLALEPGPVDRPKSDGAGVTLSIVGKDGAAVAVERQELLPTEHDYVQWRVDLSKWAGQDVTVRLASDTLDTPVLDWVFVGSPSIWGPPESDVRRVVVIALDTTRPDHLSMFGYGKPTTPEIDRWANTGMVFDHTWSTAPRTRPSFRSSTTGRLPLPAVGATNIAQVFQQHGFATQGIVANVHLQPRFDFDVGFDAWQFDGKANVTDQVDRSLAWLHENLERDTYLFVHVMDPHMPYDPPEEYAAKFVNDPDPELPPKVRREQVLAWMNDKDPVLDDRRKQNLVGLHDADLAFTSAELGRFFDDLDKMPGRTLVVLHSDHGEEFWEHGGFEHNHSLYDELVRVVLVMRPRGGLPQGQRLDAPVSLMDIAPTLYDLFGFTNAPEVDGQSLMPVMAGVSKASDRALPVGYLQYAHERWGVVWHDHKYVIHTGSGLEELFDLTADPDEKTNIADRTDLEPYRLELKEAHAIPIGPGWRIALDLEPKDAPMTIELPAPAIAADVLDPEAIVQHRANIEWGELPKKLPGDVGHVTLSDDKRKLTFTPGPDADGMLYVLFDTAQPADGAKVALGDRILPLSPAKRGQAWREGKREILIDPGTVVIPPPTEADRMGIGPGAAGAADEMAALCALGYIECEEEDEEGAVSDDDEGAAEIEHE